MQKTLGMLNQVSYLVPDVAGYGADIAGNRTDARGHVSGCIPG